MSITAAQYRLASSRGSLRRQVARVVDNTTQQPSKYSHYYRRGHYTIPLCASARTVFAGMNAEGLFLGHVQYLMDPTPPTAGERASVRDSVESIAKRAGPRGVSVIEQHVFVGLHRAEQWHLVEMHGKHTKLEMDAHGAAAVHGVALHPRDSIDRPLALGPVGCHFHPSWALLKADTFVPVGPERAANILRGAEYYLLRSPRVAVNKANIWNAAVQTAAVASFIGAASYAGASAVMTCGALFGTGMLMRAASRGTQWYAARSLKVDGIERNIWTLMYSDESLRAEPLIVEGAVATFKQYTEAQVLAALQRMTAAGYIKQYVRQMIDASGAVHEVDHYELLRRPPPRGGKRDPDQGKDRLRLPELALHGVG